MCFFGVDFFSAAPAVFSRFDLLLFYTDPGSGAMLWQMIAAFFVSGVFYFTFTFRRVRAYFHEAFERRRAGIMSNQESPSAQTN